MSAPVTVDEYNQTPAFLRQQRRDRWVSFAIGAGMAVILILTLAGTL